MPVVWVRIYPSSPVSTDIPRTLTMALYADMNVSVIDEMPPGRHPIKTTARGESHSRAGVGLHVHSWTALGDSVAATQTFFLYAQIWLARVVIDFARWPKFSALLPPTASPQMRCVR